MTIDLFDGVEQDWSYDDVSGLKNYLDEVWQNRPFFPNDEESERNVTGQKFFTISGKKIKPKNYVGFVQYGNLRINVYPRVFYNHPTIDVFSDPSPAIQHVLTWLSYAKRIHFPFSDAPLQMQQQDDWLEALIFLFANFTLDTLSTSPHFAYQEVTEEMGFVRGRIAMHPYINHNLAKGRHHLVHCTYEPFLYDNQFNRIVKHTCKTLLSVSTNGANRSLLSDILFLLDEVTDEYASAEDCAKVPDNRLYPQTSTIAGMCAAFLSNQAYTNASANKQNLCILLPMEVIYEQYVAGFIQKHFSELNAIPQASKEYVALTGENFEQRVFQMKHDILIPNKLIIDTKYKFRQIEEDGKGGVSQADLYQMVTYCYKRIIKEGMLLYPVHFDVNANNQKHLFKVNDILIEACSLDITEDELESKKFVDSQLEKFRNRLTLVTG